MSEAYQIIEKKKTQRLAAFVAEHGQAFFPLVSLVEQSQLAVEDLMDVMGPGGAGGRAFAVGQGLDGRAASRQAGWRGPPARQPGGPGDPEGAQAEGEKAAASPPGPGSGRGGGGAGVCGPCRPTPGWGSGCWIC